MQHAVIWLRGVGEKLVTEAFLAAVEAVLRGERSLAHKYAFVVCGLDRYGFVHIRGSEEFVRPLGADAAADVGGVPEILPRPEVCGEIAREVV